jgi:hypothetical protein
MPNQVIKFRNNSRGLDLNASDLSRSPDFATDALNIDYRASGAIQKRKGYQYYGNDVGGLGLVVYNRVNPTTGLKEYELIDIDENVHKITTVSLEITYSGAAEQCYVTFVYDTTDEEYRMDITEGTTQVLSQGVGIGFDEVTPYSITSLAAAINALTDFTATVTGDGSIPAAFLQIIGYHDLVSDGPLTRKAKTSEQIYSITTDPLSAYEANRNLETFEYAGFANASNCLYIATKDTDLLKYDGRAVYKAGLPNVASISAAQDGGGNPNGTYYYKGQVVFYDGAGSLVEGNQLQTSSVTTVTNKIINVTVANVLSGTGYMTNCAIVAGAQGPVTTITVDNGSGGANTMKVGDTAYFKDSSGVYHEREITGRTSTTITIDGAAVSVLDNAVISNNLRIRVLRTKTTSSGLFNVPYYIVEEVANNSFASTQVVADNLADASLGAIDSPPVFDRSPPPIGNVIAVWNGQLCIAGDPENANYVYISEEGPEYFPNDFTRTYDVSTQKGDTIKGMIQDNEVFLVMKSESFVVGSGDVIGNNIRFDVRSLTDGCVSAKTIAPFNGAIGWLGPDGPRFSQNGNIPEPIGVSFDEYGRATSASRIDAALSNEGAPEELRFQLDRAIGYNLEHHNQLMFFIPRESLDGTDRYSNSNSRVFVYDYKRDAWSIFTNVDFSGGIVSFEEEIIWKNRRSSDLLGVQSLIVRHQDDGTIYDYADANLPIGGEDDGWLLCSQWEALGNPSVLKKLLKIDFFSLEAGTNDVFTVECGVETNFTKDFETASFTLDFDGTGYGEAAYGVDSYGDPGDSIFSHDLYSDDVLSFRLCFSNNVIYENVVMTGYQVLVDTPFRVEFGR